MSIDNKQCDIHCLQSAYLKCNLRSRRALPHGPLLASSNASKSASGLFGLSVNQSHFSWLIDAATAAIRLIEAIWDKIASTVLIVIFKGHCGIDLFSCIAKVKIVAARDIAAVSQKKSSVAHQSTVHFEIRLSYRAGTPAKNFQRNFGLRYGDLSVAVCELSCDKASIRSGSQLPAGISFVMISVLPNEYISIIPFHFTNGRTADKPCIRSPCNRLPLCLFCYI